MPEMARCTRVKICGLMRQGDALAAAHAGADAVGVVLADSRRRLTLDQAECVLDGVPAGVDRVGVFVDAPEALVGEAAERLGLTHLQFHGSESPEACAAAPLPVIKAFRVAAQGVSDEAVGPAAGTRLTDNAIGAAGWQARPDLACRIGRYRGAIAAVLLDTFVPRAPGGTGRVFDWAQLESLPSWAPVILAGGLDACNVAEAIRAAQPSGVDVSSGVESTPGQKNPRLIADFIGAVRAAEADRSDASDAPPAAGARRGRADEKVS